MVWSEGVGSTDWCRPRALFIFDKPRFGFFFLCSRSQSPWSNKLWLALPLPPPVRAFETKGYDSLGRLKCRQGLALGLHSQHQSGHSTISDIWIFYSGKSLGRSPNLTLRSNLLTKYRSCQWCGLPTWWLDTLMSDSCSIVFHFTPLPSSYSRHQCPHMNT